jgi:uncharacterized RmlC-like cupin family protein
MITKIPIEPIYRKDNDLWNLDTLDLPFPEKFQVKVRNIVYIPAGEFGGNHKHPRTEAFIGIGDELFIMWQDDVGKKHEEKMMEDKQLYLFFVEPFTPHAIINKSSGAATLVEFADGPNVDVERVAVLNVRQ